MYQDILKNKVAIVTGSGRGIGRIIALSLAGQGVRVALTARTEQELRAVQAEIESFGGQATYFLTDVSSEPEVKALISNTMAQFGRLDILVNNAGIGVFKPVVETTTAEWDRIMAINARGTFLLCREAIPYLKQQERSFIINITSVVGIKGYVDQAAYSASKHAIMGLTKSLAKEVQQDGILVHAIAPGATDTDMIGPARPDLDRSVLMKPEEMADIVLFLVSRTGNAIIDQIQVRRAASTPWA